MGDIISPFNGLLLVNRGLEVSRGVKKSIPQEVFALVVHVLRNVDSHRGVALL